jgi:hypothetical protein
MRNGLNSAYTRLPPDDSFEDTQAQVNKVEFTDPKSRFKAPEWVDFLIS